MTYIFKKRIALTSIGLMLLLAGLAIILPRLRASDAPAHDTRPARSRLASFPGVFLWAWERPENLAFINTREVGVAYLAGTLYLRGERVVERPRLQPLRVPTGTTLIAVVRIESVREEPPALSHAQRTSAAEALARLASKQNVAALQIDFDAATSEREFYRNLLKDVRGRLPETVPLSITALTSWCIGDNWLEGLPIDEAVPMLFQMGVDHQRIESYLNGGGDFRAPLCQGSAGVSTDEPVRLLPSVSRVYIFSPRPWTELTARMAIERSLNEAPAP